MNPLHRNAALALGAVLLGLLLWTFTRPPARHPRAAAPTSTASTTPRPQPEPTPPTDPAEPLEAEPLGDAPTDAGALDAAAGTGTTYDPALRAALLTRIVRSWQVMPDAAAPAAQPRLGRLPAEYIRARLREDLIPMATTCYEHLLARSPGARGRVVLEFTLLAAAGVGGVVEDASLRFDGDAASPLAEASFATCLRESAVTVAFAPPEQGGRLTVRYPLTFAPDPADGGALDAATPAR